MSISERFGVFPKTLRPHRRPRDQPVFVIKEPNLRSDKAREVKIHGPLGHVMQGQEVDHQIDLQIDFVDQPGGDDVDHARAHRIRVAPDKIDAARKTSVEVMGRHRHIHRQIYVSAVAAEKIRIKSASDLLNPPPNSMTARGGATFSAV